MEVLVLLSYKPYLSIWSDGHGHPGQTDGTNVPPVPLRPGPAPPFQLRSILGVDLEQLLLPIASKVFSKSNDSYRMGGPVLTSRGSFLTSGSKRERLS